MSNYKKKVTKRYLTQADIRLKPRRPKSVKGENGKVLIIAGSKDYVGAAFLCGLAAFKSGCDLVTIMAPEKVAWAINSLTPDLITKKLKGEYYSLNHIKQIIKYAKNSDVVLVGPGITNKSNVFLKRLIKRLLILKKPLVLDAQALKNIKIQDVRNCVLTPHLGELKNLLKNSKINNIQKNLNDNVVIVKSYVNKIITKDNVFYNKTGNASMTKGGTGDILAGICAGLISQGNSLEMSAKAALYYNGLIGDYLYNKYGVAYLTSDMLKYIKKLIRK